MVTVAVVFLVTAACSSSSKGLSPTSTSAPLKPRIYAALGDSYAAGEGLAPFEADSGNCHRSPQAHPRLVAAQEGSTLDFAPCTGATVDAVVRAGGQLASVDPRSDLVTVTVGGNDLGFAEVIGDCVIDADPCSHLDAQVEASLAKLGPALEAAYRQIKARAPGARLLVVGYPQVVADPAKVAYDACSAVNSPIPGRRVGADDAVWLRQKGAQLSDVIQGAAKAAGASYVDVAGDFAGHEACSADPWLTGVVLTNLLASFHPTAAGQAELARLVIRALA
ncbi:MAG TPA: SGNH/GDSL hydrolase family protein [Acidimicrobiales bacterium]|nr:SGNH/GDSL hydrolase family protein [Acidimicrobiales bacterium]